MLPKRRNRWAVIPLFAVLIASLSGCTSYEFNRAWLPGVTGVTNHTERIVTLWAGSWVVLYSVGLIAWGLMFWAIIVYRRRKGDTEIPPQLRYNMPIEALFTAVPLVLVLGFFAVTARDIAEIEKPVASEYRIEVVGKQWSWDFNYTNDNVYDSGIQLQAVTEQAEKELPTLYLPVNKTIQFDLISRDVIHSFWVIDFLYKKDVFPGKVNKMYLTPQVIGTYKGKCAELCGEFHSMMLFNVKVVSQEDYDARMDELAKMGNVGQLSADPNDPDNINRNKNLPGNKPKSEG